MTFADLLVDEFVVCFEVGGHLRLIEGVLIGDIEFFEELGEGLLHPFVLGEWKIEHLHQQSLEISIKIDFLYRLACYFCLEVAVELVFELKEKFIEGKTVVSVQLQVN